MNDNQKNFDILNRDLDHKIWLYNIGLRETHEILYIIEYGRGYKTYG